MGERGFASQQRLLTDLAQEFASAAPDDHRRLLDEIAGRLALAVNAELCVIRVLGTSGAELAAQNPSGDPARTIVVPLRSGGNELGVATVTRSRSEEPFHEDDVRFVREVATHAALAITNARLFAERAWLAEIARELAAAVGDYHAVHQVVAQRLVEAVGGDASCVVKLVENDEDPVEPATLTATRLTIPVLASGRPIGVAALTRSEGQRAFTAEDQRLAEEVMSHAALALRNARLLEAGLHTDEVLRRGFLEAAPDAVFIANSKGAIVLVNSQAEALFGYERADLIGKPIEVLVPERLRAPHVGLRAGYFRRPTTRPMGGLNLSAVRRDGTEFAAEIRLSPIETPAGLLVAAAVRDVTDRKREMEERNLRMQEANRLKSEFLANMSHELRTPLNAIIGFASLMHSGKVGPVAEEHREYLGDILNSSRHLLQLINDVLDLAKIESGKMTVHCELVDLAKVVGEVRDILRGLAAEKQVKLETRIEGALANITTDPRLLKQVLYNFLSNAIKFTPEGGRVTLSLSPAGDDRFRVEVSDTGIGIAEKDLARLFVEFQQLDASAAKRYAGTGLGLALTKRIVDAQRGDIGVSSVLGQGSTFFAVLPRVLRIGAEA